MTENTRILPISEDIVEFGIVRMRTFTGESPQEAYRPRMCLWVHQRSGMILECELIPPADDYYPQVLSTFGKVNNHLNAVPGEIQLRDLKLAAQLKQRLEPAGIKVVVRESLPHLDEAIDSLMDFKKLSGKPEPSLLDVAGMTLDHVAAFAEAAKVFYEAKPWQHLLDDDLIAIESPAGPKGTKFTQVLGAGGRTFGLGFVASRKIHDDMTAGGGIPRGSLWQLVFDDIDNIPFDDGELWERHGLPVAAPDAYPAFLRFSKSKRPAYPTPAELTWAEGLLRALAATTEDELDAGRWKKTVHTFNGETTYELSLPLLLEQISGKSKPNPAAFMQSGRIAMESMMRAMSQKLAAQGPLSPEEQNKFLQSMQGQPQTFKPTNDAERAQALCYQAHDSRGRRQVQLARQALAIDPDCCDALLILAERTSDPEITLPLFERAVEAGRRQLGQARFDEDAGHFWGILATRPYMRARNALATTLASLERYTEAAAHFEDLIRLNPRDNQGNRYHLAQCLLTANQLDRLDVLLNRSYRDDPSPEWIFTRALLIFRREGDSASARARLGDALRSNTFVAPLLTGRAPLPIYSPDSFSPGDQDEAVVCFEQIAEEWVRTPGAIDWLQRTFSRPNPKIRQWQRERQKKGRRRR